MADSLDDILAPYDYVVPQELIAQSPANPRDSAKLLVYNRATKKTSFDVFQNIIDYLPENCVLVFNRTKVFPARMHLKKETGGHVGVLFLNVVVETSRRDVSTTTRDVSTTTRDAPTTIRVLAEGKIKPGDTLTWEDGHTFTVLSRDEKEATLTPSFPLSELQSLLMKYGETPLPPYIKNSPLSEDQKRSEYQTVFATQNGSVAAPTAGLHFTENLITKIAQPCTQGGTMEQSGRSIRYVTLHVNLGTFAPLTEEHWQQKKLHEEYYEIDADTATFLNAAKKKGQPIIAVGTTTVRTLESAARSDNEKMLTQLSGVTDNFITEHDKPKFVDGLITNFHVPRSSLLMLVSAFSGRETLLNLYKQAIDKEFRFFSFGDGMMII